MNKKSHREIKKTTSTPKESVVYDYKPLRRTLGIIIACFAFFLYAQSISFSYTLDDGACTSENKITTQGLRGIPTLLTTDYWYGYQELLRVPQYRPASLILLAAEWQFFPNRPYVSHLVNVLLFALSCWLLFTLLCELSGNQNLIVPFVCCLLYVSHPIHTEVVNSIKSVDDILCFLFFIMTSLLVLKHLKNKSPITLIFASVVYYAALLSKETSLTFLLVIPLMIFVFTKSTAKQIGTIAISLASVAVIYLLIRVQVVKSIPGTVLVSALNNTLYAAPDFVSREATAFYILLRYIVLLIIPHPLSYDYSYSQVKIHSITDVSSLLGIIVYFAISIYAVMNVRKRSIVAFTILFYLITLAVTSNVFILIGATMAERFLYIPSLGYCILLTLLIAKLTKTKTVMNKPGDLSKSKFAPAGFKQFISANSFLFVLVFVITAAFSVKTFARSRDWKNNMALFGHDVKVADNSARAHHNWGDAIIKHLYPKEKDENKKSILLDQSIAEFTKAISIYTYAPVYYADLGNAYTKKFDHVNAINNYEIAIANTPIPDWESYSNLGYEYGAIGRFDDAIRREDTAIKYKPGYAMSWYYKGCALGGKGKYEESIPVFLKAVTLDSTSADAYNSLGVSYFHLQNYSKAIEYYNKSLALDSTNLQTINNMGLAYKMLGDMEHANFYTAKYNRKMTEGK